MFICEKKTNIKKKTILNRCSDKRMIRDKDRRMGISTIVAFQSVESCVRMDTVVRNRTCFLTVASYNETFGL